jgi:hypothetical protein
MCFLGGYVILTSIHKEPSVPWGYLQIFSFSESLAGLETGNPEGYYTASKIGF